MKVKPIKVGLIGSGAISHIFKKYDYPFSNTRSRGLFGYNTRTL